MLSGMLVSWDENCEKINKALSAFLAYFHDRLVTIPDGPMTVSSLTVF